MFRGRGRLLHRPPVSAPARDVSPSAGALIGRTGVRRYCRAGPTLAMRRCAPFAVRSPTRAALLEPVTLMTAPFMTTRITRRLSGALFLCLTALAACKTQEPKVVRHRGLVLPPVDKGWAPASVTTVRGVP